jgi:Bacterial sugar transferase
VHGLREYHSSEDKAQFDVQYIYRWSLFLDLSIFLQTIWTLAFRPFIAPPAAPAAANPPNPTNSATPSDKQRWAIREGLHVNSTQPGSN